MYGMSPKSKQIKNKRLWIMTCWPYCRVSESAGRPSTSTNDHEIDSRACSTPTMFGFFFLIMFHPLICFQSSLGVTFRSDSHTEWVRAAWILMRRATNTETLAYLSHSGKRPWEEDVPARFWVGRGNDLSSVCFQSYCSFTVGDSQWLIMLDSQRGSGGR